MGDLHGLIKNSGLKQSHIIETLGLSYITFKKKTKNPSTFTIGEMALLKKLIGAEIDTLTFVNFFTAKK